MDNLCAPQWADFMSSPQRLSDSYFETIHELHEPQLQIKPDKASSSLSFNVGDVMENGDVDAHQNNGIAKGAYSMPSNSKKQMVDKTATDTNLHKAMTKLKLDNKPRKAQATWNLSVNDSETTSYKTPILLRNLKSSPLGNIRRSICLPVKNESIQSKSLQSKSLQSKSLQSKSCHLDYSKTVDDKQEDKVETALITKGGCNVKLDMGHCPKDVNDDSINRRLSYKIVTHQRRHSNRLSMKRCSPARLGPRVLTCQYRRQSLIKYRRRSNKFVSLAEAVSKFQNGTPERFRTISNKDVKYGPSLKMKWSPLKLTQPISPALRAKQRTRHARVLTQQEREAEELKEMKKNQIKAKPIPASILKGPSTLKKVAKKPATITVEFHLTQPKRTRQTIDSVPVLVQATDTKDQHNSTAISDKTSDVRLQKSTVKSVAYTLPITFEARNKEFQMRKEKKLKELQNQETTKTKVGFHARPVPNFTKMANPVKEHSTRKSVVPCPFSFETRDKCLAKKKVEQVKQMKDENTKQRVFHANPVPTFKPVIVHGLSKENLRGKDKTLSTTTKTTRMLSKSVGDQENKQPNVNANATTIHLGTKKKEIKQFTVDNVTNEIELKDIKNIEKNLNNANDNTTAEHKKLPLKVKVPSVELNTDKRAKERCEFNEKIRRKEQTEEAKRQEELENKLMREKMDRAELRKLAEVKARPMPVYKPLIVLKSTKQLVSPKSPAWGSKCKPKCVS